ncbi:telomeric repeat-binding factor 1-like isoform X2 [Pocillopora damicornis]|uniref:telomeric repeat-binding factor 1-like isoform X2 n=1 Tax=Pocillopora damicornis TaxID=46731 RepID=UPI000F54E258|nr:telomeric repeat-binding factor 1-like isoform X2 [Pocillopora damicornis]
MAGKPSNDANLLGITSEWFLDYCIYQLWKEFKEKHSFSGFWRNALQDYLLSGRHSEVGKELSDKLNCIRFIIGLWECQEDDVGGSQESSPSDDEGHCEQIEKGMLGPECLKFFEKVTCIFPFSQAERSHMKSSLKLQIILSCYRCGDIQSAENLFSRLYSENGYDEAPLLENATKERPRIDAKTIKALYFAWDTSDEIEENWKSIVEGTHPDISILKKKIGRGKIKTTSPILPQQRVTKSNAEASSTTAGSSMVHRIQQCQVVINNLKQSSKNLFSGVSKQHSYKVAAKAGPSRVIDDKNNDNDKNDDDGESERHYKTIIALPVSISSPSGSNQHKRERKSLEKRPIKRRYNENHSDAEEIDWASDDEETVFKHKSIILPSLAKPRHLNIKLPVGSAKKFWSADETRWLEEGVELYGTGNWAKILKKYNFVGRTSVNLKDKWRNLKKNS